MAGPDGIGDGGCSGGGAAADAAPPADAWQLAAALAAPHLDLLRCSPRTAHARSGGFLAAGTDAGEPRGAASPLSDASATPPPGPGPLPPPPLRVLRSSQVDALRLDAELRAMLHEQLSRLFEYFSPGQAAKVEPEVDALLSLLVFALSVCAGRATPGAELLNLRYRNERAVAAGPPEMVGATGVDGPRLSVRQRAVLGLGSVLLPYVWTRLGRTAHAQDWAEYGDGGYTTGDGDGEGQAAAAAAGRRWRRGVWRAMRWAEAALAAAALANSWVFLVRGDYRTLLERLVGARLVWRQARMTRIISFEYLNRQLMWQQLSEALLLLLPMLDLARLRRSVLRVLPSPRGALAAAAASAAAAAGWVAGGGGSGTVGASGGAAHAGKAEGKEGAVAVHGGAGVAADGGGKAGGSGGEEGAPASPPAGPCPVCGAGDILTAVRALPCRHVFCYYCLRANTQADAGFACPLDGTRVAAMRRVPVRQQSC